MITGLHSWRRLGDAISSLTALGYHEEPLSEDEVPPFLSELRKAAFARIYADDKNVALFLGRPPRLSARFCFFQTPSFPPDAFTAGEKQAVRVSANFMAEARCNASFARLKEKALDLFRDRDIDHKHRVSK